MYIYMDFILLLILPLSYIYIGFLCSTHAGVYNGKAKVFDRTQNLLDRIPVQKRTHQRFVECVDGSGMGPKLGGGANVGVM